VVVLLAYLGLIGLSLGGLLLVQSSKPVVQWRRLTRHVVQLDNSKAARRWAIAGIQCGVPAYLLVGALLLPRVPPDISLSSLILLVILLIRLIWSDRLRFLSLRLLVFPSIAFAVYLMHRDHAIMELLPATLRISLLVVLLVLMLLVIRSTKDLTFQTTPTDLLVIALAGGVGVLYQQGVIEASLVPVVLGIVVLFYAAELVMRHMRQTWNCFTLGIIGVLTLLSLRLL
jgi:nitric oxide reductase large subunit